MKIVIDTYAWIELFVGSRAGNKVKRILSEASELYTSSIVLAEIARKYLREGVDEEEVKRRLKVIWDLSIVIDIDPTVAVEAGKCYLELKDLARKMNMSPPSLADAVILAVARLLDAKILTGDLHFKDLPETIWIS